MQDNQIITENLLKYSDVKIDKVKDIADLTLKKCDDGEIFFEYNQSESLFFDDKVLKNANFDITQGFGFRSVIGESSAFAHSSYLSMDSISRAAATVGKIANSGQAINLDVNPSLNKAKLYNSDNPNNQMEFAEKINLLAQIDDFVRKSSNLVRQVSVSLYSSWQLVTIVRSDGYVVSDIRPLVRFGVSVVVEKNGRLERGSFGTGGREAISKYLNETSWQNGSIEALRQATINLESVAAPAGKMQVVLGNGWPGILLHEAVGHGLEGDFNRKKTSAFSGLVGQKVAADNVTVVDDGTIFGRRGSLNIDDEGTPTSRNILIENGILRGYIQDRMNARLMGAKSTGNGRRESYAHQPLPRMTNTCMLSGNYSQDEIIRSVDNGIYAVNFGGGQVDITSGKFVFSASEAYLIKKGKIDKPVKGVTLIGNGPDVLTKVSMVGNDMQLDPGIGTCGKEGQSVPVGVGQPTILVDELTVGGTEVL